MAVRQSLAVLQANGRKHLTKAEIAERSAAEVHLKSRSGSPAPAWSLEDLVKGDFRKISKELLDADRAHRSSWTGTPSAGWSCAGAARGNNCMVRDLAGSGKHGNLPSWSTLQEKYFAGPACANDLGLTITSRCCLTSPREADRQNKKIRSWS